MSTLMPEFRFDGNHVRVQLDEHGEPWFVAADVCRCLGIANSRQAVSRLEERQKGVCIKDTRGGLQRLCTVSEGGLYTLVLTSRRPEAQRFKSWVTDEVLPSIRKTGSYTSGDLTGAIAQIDVRDAAQLAPITLQLVEYVNELKGMLAEAAPKVEGYEELIAADGYTGLQQTGKLLGLKPNGFIAMLVEGGYLFHREGTLVPYQKFIEQGLFVVRSRVFNDVARAQTFITKKGFDHFWRSFCSTAQRQSQAVGRTQN